MDKDTLLIRFVSIMQRRYPDIIFRFEFDRDEELYRIWHTNADVYEDDKFNEFIGKLISEIFVPCGFFDYYIELNALYVENLKSMSNWIVRTTTEAEVEPHILSQNCHEIVNQFVETFCDTESDTWKNTNQNEVDNKTQTFGRAA